VLENDVLSNMLKAQIDELYDDMRDAKQGMKECEEVNSSSVCLMRSWGNSSYLCLWEKLF
jgi:hypothetical protein